MALSATTQKSINAAIYLALVIGVIFLYSVTWRFEFLWDDNIFFDGNMFFKTDKLSNVFLSTLPGDFSAYYRPSTQVIFSLLERSGSGKPAVFHIFSTIIHCISVILIATILMKIYEIAGKDFCFIKSRMIIFFWSGFYAFHPVMVETVSWVSSNFDLQMTFWILLLFYSGISIEKKPMQFLSGAIFFFLACSSKEICIMFPLICFGVFCLIFEKDNPSKTIGELFQSKKSFFAGIFGGGIGYLLLRLYVMHGALSSGILIDKTSFFSQIQDAIRAIFWYTKNLILPFYGLGPVSDPKHIYEFEQGYLYGGIILCATLASLLVKRKKVAFPFAIFLIALAPVLHVLVVIYGPSFVSDRYMAYPLAMFVISGCTISFYVCQKNSISRIYQYALSALATFYMLSLIVISHSMVPMWRDNISLWSLLYARHPYSTYAFSQLVASYGIAGDCNRVESLVAKSGMRSAALDGSVAKCIIDKDPARALALVEHALSTNEYLAESQMSNLLDTMAYAQSNLGNYEKALEVLNDIMKAYPSFHMSRIRYIEVLMKACKYNEAEKAYDETLLIFSGQEQNDLKDYWKIWIAVYEKSCIKNSPPPG